MTVATIQQGGAVAHYAPRTLELTGAPPVDSWIPLVAEIAKFSDYVAMTQFVPGALRGKPAAVAACILTGREIGLGPMTALKHIHMVDGTPTLSAEMARAKVQAAGHEIRFGERTKERCVIHGRRRGEKEWTDVTYTIEDAQEAGLLDPSPKTGNVREPWFKHRRRQLIARASGELCHTMFADVINGVAIREEIQDLADAYDESAAPETAPPAAQSPYAAPANEAAPAQDRFSESWIEQLSAEIRGAASVDVWRQLNNTVAAAARDGLAADAAERLRGELRARQGQLPAAPVQQKRMHAALGALQITSDEDRHLAMTNVVGRQIVSASDLTGAEADLVWRRASEAAQDGGRLALLHPSGDGQDDTDAAVPEGYYRDPDLGDVPLDAGVDPAEFAS